MEVCNVDFKLDGFSGLLPLCLPHTDLKFVFQLCLLEMVTSSKVEFTVKDEVDVVTRWPGMDTLAHARVFIPQVQRKLKK